LVSVTSGRKRVLERGAASDLWRHTLAHIPSVFCRAVYLAGVRNPNTGRYEHHGMALVHGYTETDRALHQSHEEVFQEWLDLDMRAKRDDLNSYLAASLGPRKKVLDTWSRLKPYLYVVPIDATSAQREHFRLDIETLLKVFMTEHGMEWPNTGA
jgi:hypothetical protein